MIYQLIHVSMQYESLYSNLLGNDISSQRPSDGNLVKLSRGQTISILYRWLRCTRLLWRRTSRWHTEHTVISMEALNVKSEMEDLPSSKCTVNVWERNTQVVTVPMFSAINTQFSGNSVELQLHRNLAFLNIRLLSSGVILKHS